MNATISLPAWSRRKARSRVVQTCDGVALAVTEYDGAGPPCVLIHGFADGSYVWRDLVEHYLAARKVVAIDMRGHGCSSWDAAARYELSTHVADVITVLQHLQIDRFILVGHSLGGKIASCVADMLDGQVRGLVIVDTQPNNDVEAQRTIRQNFCQEHRRYGSIEEYRSHLFATRPLSHLEQLGALAREALTAAEDGTYRLRADPKIAEGYRESPPERLLWQAFSTTTCPTLIVRGAYSGVLDRKTAQQMIDTFVNARLVTVPNAGHAVMLDNPGHFGALLQSHIAAIG